jgi:hypothetical protein
LTRSGPDANVAIPEVFRFGGRLAEGKMKSLIALFFAVISAPLIAFALLAPLHAATWNTGGNSGVASITKVGSLTKPALKARHKAKPIPKIVIISPMAIPQGGNLGGASATSMSKTIVPGGVSGPAAGTEATAGASGPGTT